MLAKIVKYMRQRHQDGDMHPLSIEDILDETNQLDVGAKVKHVITSSFIYIEQQMDILHIILVVEYRSTSRQSQN